MPGPDRSPVGSAGTTTRRAILAAGAAVALAALDGFLLTVSFLHAPMGFWIVAGFCLTTFVAAVALPRRWLAFVGQIVVTAVLVYRLAQYAVLPEESRGPWSATNLIVPLGAVVVGNLLAWVVARALPARPRPA